MKYALLIYTSEAEDAKMSEAEQKANMDEYFAYTAELNAAGAQLGGEALMPTMTAKSVRVRDGNTVATDGPFAETKEQLGGFYLISAGSVEEAVNWAAKIPGARHGVVEVRQIFDFE